MILFVSSLFFATFFIVWFWLLAQRLFQKTDLSLSIQHIPSLCDSNGFFVSSFIFATFSWFGSGARLSLRKRISLHSSLNPICIRSCPTGFESRIGRTSHVTDLYLLVFLFLIASLFTTCSKSATRFCCCCFLFFHFFRW